MVCPGAKTRLSTGPEYEAHIIELNRRGSIDEVSMQVALDGYRPFEPVLVPAKTGDVSEYVSLPDKNVTPAVPKAIADWLRR